MGPYQVDTVFNNGTVRIITIDEDHTPFIVNGNFLRIYHRLASRDSLIKHIFDNFGFEVISATNSSFAPLI